VVHHIGSHQFIVGNSWALGYVGLNTFVTAPVLSDSCSIGWYMFTKVIDDGDGILYGILPNGLLRWYRHTDAADTATPPKWAGPTVVGNGWQNFVHVFSGGEGVIYAVDPNGQLLWYRHKSYLTGEFQWEGAKDGRL